MHLLFVFLFGAVLSFILYLSYHTHVVEKNAKTDNKLNENKEIIETKENFKEEKLEKVEDKKKVEDKNEEVVETIKFKAKRNKKTIKEDEEEII